MKLKLYTIRLCQKDEYNKLVCFLHDYWNANHVFCRNKEIFEFQHGKAKDGEYHFVIAIHNETQEIHAVLGFILPSTYDNSDPNSPKAVYGALWKVRDDAENNEIGKLGLGVLSFLLKRYPDSDYITLGLSRDSQAIYEALHFDFGRMNHYYVASDYVNEFRIAENPIVNKSPVNNDYCIKCISEIPDDFDSYYYPVKNKEYIVNRYLSHPFYEYKLMGILNNDVLKTVWIIRECMAEGRKCLRIIDMIGNIGEIDNIEGNIIEFLKENDAEYIDCYNYGINKEVFLKIGFKEVSGDTIIPNYFEPFEKKNVDIHYAAYARKPAVIFKGDGDQDRPNLLEEL